jgi:hypothetical protein
VATTTTNTNHPPPPSVTTKTIGHQQPPSLLTTIADYKYFWITKKKLLLLEIRNHVGKYPEKSIIQHYILNIFFQYYALLSVIKINIYKILIPMGEILDMA